MVFDLGRLKNKNKPRQPKGFAKGRDNMTFSYVAQPDEAQRKFHPGAYSDPIFATGSAPVGAFCAMLNVFFSDEYPEPGVHEDNEGFFVVSGRGTMKIAGAEYELVPGTAMVAPAGVAHAIKKRGDEDLRVFLYHFPK